MVKPPKIRHSKTRRDPVTIELEPGAVSRVEDESQPVTPAAEAGPSSETVTAAMDEAKGDAAAEPPDSNAEARGSDGNREPDWVSFEPADADRETNPGPAEEEDRPSAAVSDRPSQDNGSSMPGIPREEPRKESRGGLSGVAAGLIGGIVALAGAGGLHYAGLLPLANGSGDGAAVSALQAEIVTLKEQFGGIQTGGGGDAESLRQQLAESASRIEGLGTDLDRVKADVAGLKSAVESGGAGENAGLGALQEKVAEIESSLTALGRTDTRAAPADVTAVTEKLAAVETAVSAATTAVSANEGRLATVEKGLGTLEQSLGALTGKVDAQASQPKVALAIAVSALKTAVEAGGPFASEVETFAAVAPDSPELAELRSIAEKGVPSRDEIAAETPGAAGAMLDAGRTVDDNAGYFQRLLSSAESLVKVRPVGPVEGAGVPETVARLEAALESGDYAKAIAEYDTLPEAPKAAGHTLMEKVRARLAAEQLVDKATAAALKA